jgi:hypothetical protein
MYLKQPAHMFFFDEQSDFVYEITKLYCENFHKIKILQHSLTCLQDSSFRQGFLLNNQFQIFNPAVGYYF